MSLTLSPLRQRDSAEIAAPVPAAAAATATPTSGRATLRTAGRGLSAVGAVAILFLVYEFLLTGLAHDRTQNALLTEFKQQVPTTTVDSPTTLAPEGSAVALLDIGRIGLHQVVVEGTSPDDLKAGPGHLRASPQPGEFGYAVIAGRRTTYGAAFRDLDRLGRGDAVTVTTGQGAFVYQVTDVRRVPAGENPLPPTRDTRLALVTSDPAFVASGRLVVVATLRGAPIAVATRPRAPVGAADAGLAGEPLGAGLALAWGLLLAVALWTARRQGRRWPRPVTYMFATPVLLTLAVLAFSTFDRVLPGTL